MRISILKPKAFYLLIIISSLLLNGCAQEELFQADFFAFGVYEGRCQKDCLTVYKLERDVNIYQDNNITISDAITYSNEAYSLAQVNRVRWLKDNIPNEILFAPTGNIGKPTITYPQAYYIEIQTSSSNKKWRIDSDRSLYSDPKMLAYLDSISIITNAL